MIYNHANLDLFPHEQADNLYHAQNILMQICLIEFQQQEDY